MSKGEISWIVTKDMVKLNSLGLNTLDLLVSQYLFPDIQSRSTEIMSWVAYQENEESYKCLFVPTTQITRASIINWQNREFTVRPEIYKLKVWKEL